MDSRYQNHKIRPESDKNFMKVTSNQAEAFLKSTGILLHVGLPVCENHGHALNKILAESIVEKEGFSISPHYDDFGSSPHISRPIEEDDCFLSPDDSIVPNECNKGSLSNSKSGSSSSSSSNSQNDPTYQSRDDRKHFKPPITTVSKEVQDAFYSFAKSTGAKKLKPLAEFDAIQRRTQQKKVCAFNSFMDIIASIMAGDQKSTLISMAKSSTIGFRENIDKNTEKQLAFVKAQYNAASSREIRLNVLSQVAHIFPYMTILNIIPGLSQRFYSAARKKAKQRLECWDSEKPKRIHQRFYQDDVDYFIDFIMSPPLATMLPSAYISVKTPDGKKTTIPAVLRRYHDAEIINMFRAHVKESGSECLLKEYVMRKILKVCLAKHQKSLQCVDYFMANGEKAFSDMKTAMTTLNKKKLIDDEWHKGLMFGLQESQHYLKSDFYGQLKFSSRISDLCMAYALSDPDSADFRAEECSSLKSQPHRHDLKTDRIRLFDKTIIDIRYTLEGLLEEASPEEKIELSEMRDDIAKWEKDVLEWKNHILRSAYSNYLRDEIVNGLKNGEAFITMDYAQRYLPSKHVELQSDYFGKKGMSWHVSHILANVSSKLVQHTIVHLLGEEDQDGQAVAAILGDVFVRAKKLDIKAVTLRCDNAGYYKSAPLIVSLPSIAAKAGIKLNRFSFSESQSGKAVADRETGRFKRRMRYFLNQGSDIQNAKQMKEAITSGAKPLSGVTVVVATLNAKAKSKATIPLISYMHDFVYEAQNIRYWRHFGIGKGKRLEYKQLENFIVEPTLTMIEEWDHDVNDPAYLFWISTDDETPEKIAKPKKPKKTKDDEDEYDGDASGYDPQKLFSCPVGTCTKQYDKLGNLHNHLIKGDHKFVAEKYTLQEYAFKVYKRHLEGNVESRLASITEKKLESTGKNSRAQQKQGWALKTTKKGNRYTSDMRQFLDEELTKFRKKPDVKLVESEMASARNQDGTRRFLPEQQLNYQQIGAYYKRLKEKIQKQKGKGKGKKVNMEEEAEEVIREMNEENGEIEIEYEDDAAFFDNEDTMRQCVGDLDVLNNEQENGDIGALYEDEAEFAALIDFRTCD